MAARTFDFALIMFRILAAAILFWLCWLCVSNAGHFANLAFATMTPDVYAKYCDNKPECYPEIGFLFLIPINLWFAVFLGGGGAIAVLSLVERLSQIVRKSADQL